MRIFRVARRKKRSSQKSTARGSVPAFLYLRSCVFGFRNTSFLGALSLSPLSPSLVLYYGGPIHPPGDTSAARSRGRKKYCAVNGLTCPCCSAAPPLLDCSPWTDSCCCIHSSVSLQKRRETEDEDSLLHSRLTDRRNFSWETT